MLRRGVARLRRFRVVVTAVSVALVALILVGVLAHGRGTLRRAAPALPTQVIQGPPVNLASLRGHPTLVVFWASWCGPCNAEAPAIERFARSPAGRGHIIGIADDDGRAAARRFIAHYRWTFPVLDDPQGATAAAYRLLGLPTTIVLNPAGQIVGALIGPQTPHTLAAAIARA